MAVTVDTSASRVTAFIQANESLRSQIEAMLTNIARDPTVDLKTKFWFPAPPAMFTLYREDDLWAIYHCDTCSSVARVFGIGLIGTQPSFR